MTQKSNTTLIIVVILGFAILAAGLYMGTNAVINAIPDAPVIPTAAAIAAAMPAVDTSEIEAQIADIHEKLDADEVEIGHRLERQAIQYAESEIDEDDFLELVADLIGIDEDFLEIQDLDVKEIEVSATSKDEAEDGNVKVQGFLRIKYIDTDDDDDSEVIYVLVTADIADLHDEENDQDVDYSIVEVDRDFEFD